MKQRHKRKWERGAGKGDTKETPQQRGDTKETPQQKGDTKETPQQKGDTEAKRRQAETPQETQEM